MKDLTGAAPQPVSASPAPQLPPATSKPAPRRAASLDSLLSQLVEEAPTAAALPPSPPKALTTVAAPRTPSLMGRARVPWAKVGAAALSLVPLAFVAVPQLRRMIAAPAVRPDGIPASPLNGFEQFISTQKGEFL